MSSTSHDLSLSNGKYNLNSKSVSVWLYGRCVGSGLFFPVDWQKNPLWQVPQGLEKNDFIQSFSVARWCPVPPSPGAVQRAAPRQSAWTQRAGESNRLFPH